MKTTSRMHLVLALLAMVVMAFAWVEWKRCNDRISETRKYLNGARTTLDTPIIIVDTDGTSHRILRHPGSLGNSELLEDLDGHMLVFVIEHGYGIFVHGKPCHRCAEIEFYNTRKVEPTKVPTQR